MTESAALFPRSSRAARITLLFLTVLSFVPRALAVEQTGTLKGTVHDERGQALPGAVVSVSGANLQGERATRSDVEGEFEFEALPPGLYSVKVALAGYQVIQQDRVAVHIGRITTLNVQLTPGGLMEQVTVTGSAPLVDSEHATSQDNYGPEYLEQVTLGSGRSYQDVVQNSPGTGPGDDVNPTVRGSTIGGNVYLIDGVDSTDPATQMLGQNYIYDAIEEIQLQTGGFEAEFGRASGGIVNVVTKSGGNVFSGSLDARYSNDRFFEKGHHFDPGAFNTNAQTWEATLGGPIVKDKLWFFLAGSWVRTDFAEAGFEAVSRYRGHYYLGKLTWQPTPGSKFILQTTGDPATIDNADAGPLVAREATSLHKQGARFVTAQYIGDLRSNLILQAQAAWYQNRFDLTPEGGDLDTVGYVDFFTARQTRNAIDIQRQKRFRNQANATLTWSVSDLAGDHTFKFGADAQWEKLEIAESAPGGEYDQVCTAAEDPRCASSPTVLVANVVHSAGALTNRGLVTGYFAQDEWRIVPRLSFNLGLRYDAYAYDDDRGQTVLRTALLQPRVGVSWDLTGGARDVLKLYGGRFGDPTPLTLPRLVNSRANSTDVFVNETLLGDLNGDGTIQSRAFFGSFGGPGGEAFAHGGNLDATRVVEYSAGYERQLTAVSALGLTLVRRRTDDIIEDTFDSKRGIYVIDNLPALVRRYYGAELHYRSQWKKLLVNSSYTWSKARGNIESTMGHGPDFDFPDLSVHRYGWLTDDTRHAVQIQASWLLPRRFQLAFDYDWVSGYPWTIVRSAVPYGEAFVDKRGSERFAPRHELDIDLRKEFVLGRSDMTLTLSVQNALDTETVTDVNRHVGQDGRPIEWQTPRRYQIGAHYRF